MRASSVLCAIAALAAAAPAQAAPCTRFLYNPVPFAIEFVGGKPGTPVTSWPTVLLGITILPSDPGTPRTYVRSDCGPKGYHCYRKADDPTDLFQFKVENESDGRIYLIPLDDMPGREYFLACDLLDELAEDDLKNRPQNAAPSRSP